MSLGSACSILMNHIHHGGSETTLRLLTFDIGIKALQMLLVFAGKRRAPLRVFTRVLEHRIGHLSACTTSQASLALRLRWQEEKKKKWVISSGLVFKTADDPAGSLHQHQPGHHVLQTALLDPESPASPIKCPGHSAAADRSPEGCGPALCLGP
ncbi:hypothetical protein TNCV_214251 [Trichonephila clavipes]|nr:hypothetical protein TNCV_214251 [Trichonephila clavipes]